ncbi:hypothetical protein AB0H12_27850 [Actinosynnema sp. NPDC023794]
MLPSDYVRSLDERLFSQVELMKKLVGLRLPEIGGKASFAGVFTGLIIGAGYAFGKEEPRPGFMLESASDWPIVQRGAGHASVYLAGTTPYEYISPASGEASRLELAFRQAREGIASYVGDWAESVTILAIKSPKPLCGPGGGVRCAGNSATLGARISMKDFPRSITTAGHATVKNEPAYDDHRNLIGFVRATIDPLHDGLRQSDKATADIAVIDLLESIADDEFVIPRCEGVAAVKRRHEVLVSHGANTQGRWGAVEFFGAKVSLPGYGTWAEATTVMPSISRDGDSGAMVYNELDELVGHIVSGDPLTYSVVQDAEFQFKALGDAELRE